MSTDLTPSVLIVEDNWLLAVQTETWLQEDGIACVGTASNVQDALDLAAAHQPRFALVDFNLGGELADELIAKLVANGARVIVMTGYTDIGAVRGISGTLHKPCTKNQVITALIQAGLVH